MYFRFILVNIFSFVKRFFAFNALLYKAVVFIPLFTAFSFRLSKKSILFVTVFSLIFIIKWNFDLFAQFGMYFLLLLAIPIFQRASFEKVMHRAIPFFILVSIYGVSQKYLGYSIVELNWMKSGLSFADENAFLATSEIRPFSTFASIPEFTLFISLFTYYFASNRKHFLLLFSIFMLYIAGSRGIIISTLLAYFLTFFVKKHNTKYIWVAFLISFVIFLFLIYIFPVMFAAIEGSSRILVYGTFNGRIETLKIVLERADLTSFFIGMNLKGLENIEYTFDNYYFMLIANFGILGCIYFINFFVKQKINRKNFYFLIIFLGYGFYADMIFSYYLMFLFFFALYSNDIPYIKSVAKRLTPSEPSFK